MKQLRALPSLLSILIGTLICCTTFAATTTQTGLYNILDFYNDDSTSAHNTPALTQAINTAITRCHEAGGGRVVIPPGDYIVGTLILKDNVNLHLAPGAKLLASDDWRDFSSLPAPQNPLLKNPGTRALIYAQNAANISITGQGIIDGRGALPKKSPANATITERAKNILFISCHNVRVSEITLRNSQHWNQHYLDCEDVRINGLNIYNHANGNNDGLDIDGSRRVTISDCIIDADDDGIVFKSTGAVPCEDIVVTNCIVSSRANAIKCGTESIGGFKNIAISNCIIRPSRSTDAPIVKIADHGITAISLEIVDGGVMDGVTINNILIQGTECPLFVRLANRGRKVRYSDPTPKIGSMRNIQISNITAYGAGNYGSSITGIPDGKIENISLSNIRIINHGGLTRADAYDPSKEPATGRRHDIHGPPKGKYIAHESMVIEDERGYPQPTVWGALPSHGLFLRHIKNITLNNVTFASEAEDPRPPIIAVDVSDLKTTIPISN